MQQSSDKNQEKNKVLAVTTFPVPFPLEGKQENVTIITNASTKSSKEDMIDQAVKFHLKGNIQEAQKYYQKVINQGCDDHRVFSNYATILSDLGNIKEAEVSYRKAIEINPNYEMAHYNLGVILKHLGKLQEAELSTRKAIEINPNSARAYYNLTTLKYSNNNDLWKKQIFSQSMLNNKSKEDLIDIYFARANILHKEKNYKESARYLQLANNLKLDIQPSKPEKIFHKSKVLLIESDKQEINQQEHRKHTQSIFIVGIPRSGSTLLESILSMSNNVYDLGEINILEESFLEFKKSGQNINLAELYKKKVTNKTKLNITTNKWLYNYQYAGIICRHIPNANIIHCYRNPLDNIL